MLIIGLVRFSDYFKQEQYMYFRAKIWQIFKVKKD